MYCYFVRLLPFLIFRETVVFYYFAFYVLFVRLLPSSLFRETASKKLNKIKKHCLL
jgi:hypothetical protein